MDDELTEWKFNCCNDRLKDHEERMRHLEANNKEQAKLFIISDKINERISQIDEKTQVRIDALEKWKDSRTSVILTERTDSSHTTTTILSVAAIVISIAAVAVMIWK